MDTIDMIEAQDSEQVAIPGPDSCVLHPQGALLHRSRGFTLMELMVVVVIIGILAVVAVFSYKKIQQSARKSDAIALLGEIKTKQMVFFDTYSSYESSTTDESKFDGTKLYDTLFGYYRWENDCSVDQKTPWCRLGFKPVLTQTAGESRLLYFQLQTIGWSTKTKDSPPSFITKTDERWLTMQARGIPTEEDKTCTLMRMTSESKEAMTFGEYSKCD
jgi:prepilin-type N-terminal cleavage/methylation domain-containing protein